MSNEAKKVSFGFSKINKKPNLITNKTEPKVELIKCLEGQEIKLVEEKPEEKPLIIPLKENQKTSAALASLMKRRAVLLGEENVDDTTGDQTEQTNALSNVDIKEDLEKQAARELLAEVQANASIDAASTLVLPVVKPDDLPLEGAKESSLDDYENIPIEDFGKAMLRGMGWKEPPKTNKKGGLPIDETPMVRPKGMGLGADKALNKKPLLVAPEANEVLEIKRNAFVRILGGKQKDLYGQIEGFDDHAGRVIVKMAIGGNREAFNEFLCQPVSRKEYAQYGKCINTNKYEEYKKKENEFGQIIISQDEKYKIENSYGIKDEKNAKKERYISPENEDKCKRRSDDSDEKKYIKKENNRYQDYDYKREKETSCHRRDIDSYNGKYHKSNYLDKESSRDREYRKHYRKDDIKDGYRESKRYQSQINNRRERECDFQQNYREHDRSSTSNKDRQHERDRDTNKERSEKRRNKVIDVIDSSSETENVSYSSKHKKTKKNILKKKSKKSKKNKTKYKSASSDTESSSSDTDSSSSNSEEERRQKLKKKTKKSKKQRERSRSRDRR